MNYKKQTYLEVIFMGYVVTAITVSLISFLIYLVFSKHCVSFGYL